MLRAMQTYSGGCHCGKVRYQVQLELTTAMECNCSHCQKAGYLLAFVPPEQFTLESGEDQLNDYQFNKKVIHHTFCRGCGIKSFGTGQRPDGAKMYAVNVRCLDGIDLAQIPRTPYDGRSR